MAATKAAALLALLLIGCAAVRAEEAKDPALEEVKMLAWKWNEALISGDPDAVAAMYAEDAVLLPTVSNEVRYNESRKVDYFVMFMKKDPELKSIDENYVRFLDDDKTVAGNSGLYTFGTSGGDVQARFTFIYAKENGEWKIVEHHSSLMPEKPDPLVEVAGLFDAWNAALLTGDPKKVVDMYANESVLLPTVWDGPLLTREEKEAYFVEFLKKDPKGTILESEVRFLDEEQDEAINSGIYQFDTNGGAVKARYTYVYKKQEDGTWKIVEHHSSMLPVGDKEEKDASTAGRKLLWA